MNNTLHFEIHYSGAGPDCDDAGQELEAHALFLSKQEEVRVQCAGQSGFACLPGLYEKNCEVARMFAVDYICDQGTAVTAGFGKKAGSGGQRQKIIWLKELDDVSRCPRLRGPARRHCPCRWV